ncbi:hypothetical protein H0A36_20465 [Endozoicomonas sp. SM1973]|uniref:Uncharacterized protein n=1 Tax=Spartinivicinus marinus TaxID=2994442 RepID=A0A853IEB9_9GAMM|nr:hypothetical protein [Spartinivicinus marinus]MCX4028195.1 hypothetical protein [Spartinivicinus marinus]NYZ68394.1 hypothetical protein [Spartinivicinus marinus]
MPHYDRMTSLTETEIGLHQLEKGILLFLNEQDFICSITLAGAADGIFSGLLKKQEKQTAHDALKLILEKNKHSLTPKELNDQHLNLVRNALSTQLRSMVHQKNMHLKLNQFST